MFEVIVSLQSVISAVQYYQHSVPTNIHGVRGAYVKTAQKKWRRHWEVGMFVTQSHAHSSKLLLNEKVRPLQCVIVSSVGTVTGLRVGLPTTAVPVPAGTSCFLLSRTTQPI